MKPGRKKGGTEGKRNRESERETEEKGKREGLGGIGS